jgi:histidine phosphotransfer protein HptB
MAPTIDWTALQQFWDLMEDDGEAVEDLIETFLEEIPINMKRLRETLAESDRSGLGVITHTMKGSSSTLGCLQLSELCKLIEIAVKFDEKIDFAKAVQDVENERQNVERSLAEWRQHLQVPDV